MVEILAATRLTALSQNCATGRAGNIRRVTDVQQQSISIIMRGQRDW